MPVLVDSLIAAQCMAPAKMPVIQRSCPLSCMTNDCNVTSRTQSPLMSGIIDHTYYVTQTDRQAVNRLDLLIGVSNEKLHQQLY